MNRSRSIAIAGFVAALLNNYWVIEGALARRTDPTEAWISDLAARSEAFGWRFESLEIASGLAVAVFALLLLRRLDGGSPLVRYGVLALLATGVFIVIGGAAPLNCGETLQRHCNITNDPLDALHAFASAGEVVTTTLSFALLGLGLTRLAPRHRAGLVTLILGALWLLLTALTGVSYLSGDVDAVKGLIQRAGQVVIGVWLVLLGLWGAEGLEAPQPGERSAPR